MAAASLPFKPCATCKTGHMALTIGCGRKIVWKPGDIRELPRGMFARTCSACGEVYLDGEEVTFLASIWGVEP